MNYKIIRFLDYNVGRKLSEFFALFKSKKRPFKGPVKKILLIRFWGLGTTILATPFIRAVSAQFPKAKITFLTMDKNKGLYDESSLFYKILYYSMDSIPKTIFGTLPLLNRIRKQNFDIVIDMEFFSRYSALIAFFSGARRTFGFSSRNQGRKNLFDSTVPLYENENRCLSFNRLGAPLKFEVQDLSLEPLSFTEKDRTKVDSLLSRLKIDMGMIAVFNPNAGNFAKERMWPAQRFAELADRLTTEFGMQVLFSGAPFDQPRVRTILRHMKTKGISLAGKINLTQLAYTLTRAKIFITNDSGPMHIGFAMRTPTVALFGPESPVKYGPLNNSRNRIVYKKTSCSPCIRIENQNLTKCRFQQRCMRKIDVDDVYDSAKELILRSRN